MIDQIVLPTDPERLRLLQEKLEYYERRVSPYKQHKDQEVRVYCRNLLFSLLHEDGGYENLPFDVARHTETFIYSENVTEEAFLQAWLIVKDLANTGGANLQEKCTTCVLK